MKRKNLLIVVTLWQMCAAQQNCPGVKLAAGIGSLLGDIPISSYAPELPNLPDLAACDLQGGFLGGLSGLPGLPAIAGLPKLPALPAIAGLPGLDGLPELPSAPSLPSLPYADCGCPSSLSALPCLPELPELPGLPTADCYDYPFIGQPLPYLKKKGCGCGCLAKAYCAKPKLRGCGCGLGGCASKKCCLQEKEDCGFGLKVVPIIKKFPLKKCKKFDCYDGGGVESLPYELPSLLSGAVRGSLYNNGCY